MMGRQWEKISIAVISALYITACSNGDKDHININKTYTESSSNIEVKEQKAPSKPWTPYVYSDSDEIVYRDKNKPNEFVTNLIASASKYIYKDTYETTEEYNKRLALWDHSPFSEEDVYLIEYKYPISVSYDADKQQYETGYGGIICYDGCSIGGFQFKEKYQRVYTNGAYEYRPTVIDDYTISIIAPKENLSEVGIRDKDHSDIWRLKAECPMPIEQARLYRNSNVNIGYLVKIINFKIQDDPWGKKGTSLQDYPEKITEKTIKIPAQILGYVCYMDDGKIFYKSNKLSK
ncbi:hypothetical protein [Zymobacter palmae]|uniref:Signal transduction histidine kinase n=1 Tax=Zymobacter palmae TaxID=33074 RepID=A0A348HEF1_9GAMM|nr:hypothetical protein [Zymobacter palmae]BBG30003.1 signal transduction histidine kinase [Zymobacter palmae]